jgi:hypothetical protein
MELELDHVFVASREGAPELEPLLRLGFNEGAPNVHVGQGTACRRLFFENAYLEFLWLQEAREAAAPTIASTHLAQRCAPGSGWNPFGLCFRPVAGAPLHLPFNTWDYRPPYLPPELSIPMAESAGCSQEPLLFALPFAQRPDRYPPDKRQPLEHASGARRLTRLVLHQPGEEWSDSLRAVAALGLVSLQRSRAFLLEVEFDSLRQGRAVDLRPAAPLLLRW